MPRRYRRKPKKKKRPYRRRRRMARYRKPILSGFPSSKVVKLRYVDSNLTLDAASGLTAGYNYRANSAFDPDSSGIGHQPMGFDEWSAIYTSYAVLGSRITVIYTPSTSTNVSPTYLGITLSTSPSPLISYSSIDNILESKLTSSVRVVGSTTANNMFNQNQIVHKKFSAKKFFGVRDVKDNPDLQALTSADPVQQAYYGVWVGSVDNNNPGQVSLRVAIDYIIQFREPRNLDGS